MCLIKKLKKRFLYFCQRQVQLRGTGNGQALQLRSGQVGFTLVEMLVSTFIVAVIAGLFLTNYRAANKRAELNMVALKIASDIRLAQNYTLGAKEHNNIPPKGGWGIYFDTTPPPVDEYYYIFADDNGDKVYDPGEYFQTIDLPDGVTIDDVIIDDTSRNKLYITFEPPDPTTHLCLNPSTCASDDAKIVITRNGEEEKTILVNFFGLVDVID